MPRRSVGWKSVWSLIVLIGLRLRPMHPYELQSVIRCTHKDELLHLNPGSLYNSIERLVQAGLIAVVETTRAGRRPERTTYSLTAQGRHEASKWLREVLEKPAADPAWFYAALSFLSALEPRDAQEQLCKRMDHLQGEIQGYRQVLTTLAAKTGRLNLIDLEYAVALRTAELRWIKQIIQELRCGKLSWNSEMLHKDDAADLFTICLPVRHSNNLTPVANERIHTLSSANS